MEMEITFPGGARVDANFGGFSVKTDQPPMSSAPTPFATFLASIGTCAGIYVLGFCNQRGIPTDGIRIIQRMMSDPRTGLIGQIDLDIQLPPTFPEKYKPPSFARPISARSRNTWKIRRPSTSSRRRLNRLPRNASK